MQSFVFVEIRLLIGQLFLPCHIVNKGKERLAWIPYVAFVVVSHYRLLIVFVLSQVCRRDFSLFLQEMIRCYIKAMLFLKLHDCAFREIGICESLFLVMSSMCFQQINDLIKPFLPVFYYRCFEGFIVNSGVKLNLSFFCFGSNS